MEQTRDLIALVPSYEPDENLPKIVKNLKQNNFEVIVVNDGSDINYQKYYDECDTKIISYPQNRGKGYALKKGLEYIKNNYNNYIVVTVDSDGQHKIEDVKNICEYVNNNPDTLVIGKRAQTENMPPRSLIGNTITRHIFSLLTGAKIFDTQSGLRAFSEQLIEYMLKTEGERFEYEMNVLLYLRQKNIKYKEIEIKTIYIEGNKKSHFKALRDSERIYRKIAEFKINELLTFFIDLLIFAALIITVNKIIPSNIISKIISIAIYYILSLKTIIKNKPTIKTIALQLLTLICYITLSTLLILLISNIINPYLSKIITEIALFITIQKIKNRR